MAANMDPTDSRQTFEPPLASARRPITAIPGFGVATTAVSTVAFSWLANLWSPTFPIVIAVAIVALFLLWLSDLTSTRAGHGLGWVAKAREKQLAELILVALIIGAIIGSISVRMLPRVTYRPWPEGTPFTRMAVHNYELVAVSTIVILVVIGYYRNPDFSLQAAFLTSAIFGVAMAFSFFRPDENHFAPTFLGWLAAGSCATIVLSLIPRLIKALLSFWSLPNHRK